MKRREEETQPDGPALIIPVSTLFSIVQVNIYCICVFLNVSSCRDHKLHLFDLLIHLNKPYLVSYFYLESTNLGRAHKSEQPTLPTCEVFICLLSIQTWEHISGSVFSTVCCVVATITGIYESTGKHPPTWNLSDAVVMHSILIMQNTSNSFQDPSLRNKIPKAH